MLLLKVLASFVALTAVLAAPVPTGQLKERSIGLLADAYLPTKRAEECGCAHVRSLKSVDAPRARHNKEGDKNLKYHKVDVDETLRPSEGTEIEKRTWGPVKTALRFVGLMKPSQNSNRNTIASFTNQPASNPAANTNQNQGNVDSH